MKRIVSILAIAAALVCFHTGCGKTTKEKTVATAPEAVTVALGGKTQFKVEIDRDVIKSKFKTDPWQDVNVSAGFAKKSDDSETWTQLVGDKKSDGFLIEADAEKKKKKQSVKFTVTIPMDYKGEHKRTVEVKTSTDQGKNTETTKVAVNIVDYRLKSGLIVMLISVGTVLALVSFCLIRVFTLPSVEAEEAQSQ